MSGLGDRAARALMGLWIAILIALLYVPIVSVVLASLANTRYMRFPHRVWTTEAYATAIGDFTTVQLHLVSFWIAASVAVIATIVGTLGALAFARFDWSGRRLYQRFLLLPIFFPQPVLGLALLVALSTAGFVPTWRTAVFSHLVWIAPIVTLVVAIRLYGYDPRQEEAAFDLGASRLQVFREVTLPAIAPGLVSGALFAFLLSWSNLPLSIYTTGSDTTLPIWLFTRTATNYAPVVPAVAVIATAASAAVVVAVVLAWLGIGRLLSRRRTAAP